MQDQFVGWMLYHAQDQGGKEARSWPRSRGKEARSWPRSIGERRQDHGQDLGERKQDHGQDEARLWLRSWVKILGQDAKKLAAITLAI